MAVTRCVGMQLRRATPCFHTADAVLLHSNAGALERENVLFFPIKYYEMSRKYHLYRHFDKDGILLYVGISMSAFMRFVQHNQSSSWIDDAVKMTIEKFDNINNLRIAEINAIQNEKPKFNIKHNNNNYEEIPSETTHVKSYIDDLSGLQGLTAGETRILLYVAASSDYKGMVALPTGIKSRIAKSIGCSDGAVNNAINLFCKKQILRKEGGGLYELNPDYFARGQWHKIRERRQAFYTKITYTPDGQRTVETDIIG